MSATAATYFVRDSGQWIIEVPELDVLGQTRTLAGAANTAQGSSPSGSTWTPPE